ncbi:MAG TPA: PAS domain-containing protein, partial [Thermodesulfovibrionales bacterium]|nr:PAS domain-containing protein [Thermodesulfovibrionales bacterium]
MIDIKEMNTAALSLNQFWRSNKITVLCLCLLLVIFTSGLSGVANHVSHGGAALYDRRIVLSFLIGGLGAVILVLIALYIRGLEKALRKERARTKFMDLMMNSVAEGIMVVDKNFRVVAGNEAFEEHTTRKDNAAVSFITSNGGRTRHCFELCHSLNKPCYEAGEECPVKSAFETGEPRTVVHKHKNRKGKPVWVEIKSYPIRDENGSIGHVIKTMRDITDALRNEDRIILNRKMEALSGLTGGVAHNFNNILAAIVCYGSLLKMKVKDDDCLSKYVDKILDVSDKAA